jgi:hypothetical protein
VHVEVHTEPPFSNPLARPAPGRAGPAMPAGPGRPPAGTLAAPRPQPVRALPVAPALVVRPSLDAAGERRQSTDDGPVVFVNIGRIEVRATQPPAPTPPARRRSAAVSLEEYLRPKRRDR